MLSLFPALAAAQPVRGVAGDLWADVILGHADYGIPNSAFGMAQFNEATAKTTFNPCGTYVDANHDILYLWDSGNNRILIVHNVSQAVNGQGADMVLGQPDFYHTGCNGDSGWQTYRWNGGGSLVLPSASCLCGLFYGYESPAETESGSNMASDSQGNLYVPDYFNNRVLRYDYPFHSGQAASHVWGQVTAGGDPDFSGEAPNETGGNVSGGPTSMNLAFNDNLWIAGVGLDAWGNLWVADAANNRVLRFPNPNAPNPGIPAQGADVVLGQSDFTSNTPASSSTDPAHFYAPNSVRIDAGGNVYVSEANYSFSRISVYFPLTPPSGGNPPTYAASGSAPVTQFSLTGLANGIELDPTVAYPSVGLWATRQDGAALEYNVNWSPALSINQVQNFSWPVYEAVGIAANGDLYMSTGGTGANGEDYRIKKSGGSYTADVDLFTEPAAVNGPPDPNTIGDIGFNYCTGNLVTVWAGVTQILGTDSLRIHVWNMPPGGPAALTNGRPEDTYAGTTRPYVDSKAGYGQMCQDPFGHLWAVDAFFPNEAVAVFQLPFPVSPPETAPVKILNQPLSILGRTAPMTWNEISGLTVDDAGNLWVSCMTVNTVFRVRDPLGTAGVGPVVDIILGQTDPGNGNPVGTNCNGTGTGIPCTNTNPTRSTLNSCGFLRVDHQHPSDLFVSDHFFEFQGNCRILRWDAKSLPTTQTTCLFGVPADGVYGTDGSFTAYRPCLDGYPCPPTGMDDAAYPWQVAFNSNDSIMVVGIDGSLAGRPPLIVQNPLNGIMPPGTPDNPGAGDNPVGHLNDFGPQSSSVAFDPDDNLYVGENNRSRLLIYLKPFTAPFPTPTPKPVNCCQGVALANPITGMISPGGMAVNYAKNLLYVVDEGNKALRVYNAGTGAPVTTLSTWTGGGSFSFPIDVALDAPGNIYVSDYSTGDVYVFNGTTYAFMTSLVGGACGNLRGVLVDNQGITTSVYVSSQNDYVYRFDSTTGVYPATAAASFGGSPVLNVPNEMAKSGNAVYVGDDGGSIVGFTLPGYTPSAMNPGIGSVKSLRTDLAGYFYAANPNGLFEFLSGLSNPPVACSIPNSPWGNAVNAGGTIFVGEQGSGAVSTVMACVTEPTLTPSPTPVPTTGHGTPTYTPTPSPTPTSSPTLTPSLTPTGTPTATFTSTWTALPTDTPLTCSMVRSWAASEPFGIAYGASEGVTQIYVADDSANQIDVFSPSGGPLAPIGAGTLTLPAGVAADGQGNLYVVDEVQPYKITGQAQYQVDVFTSAGASVTQWGSSLSFSGNTGLLEAPGGIAVNNAGTTVYVADLNTEQVEAFSGQGNPLFQFGGPSNFIYPTGVALDALGDVYVADWGSGLVEVFTSQGAPVTQWDATAGTPLLTANSIAVYQNCMVYVSDGFGEVGAFDLDGNFKGAIQQAGGTAFEDAQGIAMAADRSLYVADYGTDAVYELAPCPVTVCGPLYSPTPTPTASLTPTATPSATPNSTATRTPTCSPTSSPTMTITATVTSTPTEGCHAPGFYPNPCRDSLHVHFSPCDQGREVHVRIFTVVDRKVLDKDIPQVPIGTDFALDLKDNWGAPMANGLYYLVIDGAQGRFIGKLLILR